MRNIAATALALLALITSAAYSGADGKPLVMDEDEAIIYYPSELESDARRVLGLYKQALASVESSLGLRLGYRASIVLVKDSSLFRQASGSPDIAAFADSSKGLMVLDYSRVLVEPFSLQSTLKHEAAHLVLAEHAGPNLPKWLNEGMAQYLSGGPAEIALSRNASVLSGAALSERLMPFERLEDDFPRNRDGMVLAYEQSLSLVQYIVRKYGHQSLIEIISMLKQGVGHRDAIYRATGMEVSEIEAGWAQELKSKASWFAYLSENFYELLFVLGALITIYAFAKVFVRIRTYKDEPEETAPHPTHRFPFEEKSSDTSPKKEENSQQD